MKKFFKKLLVFQKFLRIFVLTRKGDDPDRKPKYYEQQ